MRFAFTLVALMAVAAFSAQAATDPSLSAAANKAFLAAYAKKPGVVTRPDGLMYRILRNGYGKRPRSIDYVTVAYTGKLINGTVFDGTEEGLPVRFKVNTLIAGWAEAMQLMKVGDSWEIVVPANLGYGEAGNGEEIPPNQTLIFEVSLKKVVPPRLRPANPNNPNDTHAGEDMGPDDGNY